LGRRATASIFTQTASKAQRMFFYVIAFIVGYYYFINLLYVSMMMNDEIEQEERVMGYVG
jgi:hypothetical protein